MTVVEIAQPYRFPHLMDALYALWRASVEATHTFLSPVEVDRIASYVPQALRSVPRLIVAYDSAYRPLGFGGVDTGKLEMLFVAPSARGCGVGKALLAYAVEHLGARSLDVNEQNPQAQGFYEHCGFVATGRSATDGQGAPYPLILMELAKKPSSGEQPWNHTIETDRLLLRPWRDSDAEALFRYASDPQVGPIAGWPPHESVEMSRTVIRDVLSAPETYAMVLRTASEVVGCVGLQTDSPTKVRPELGEAEVGYWIGVPLWGQGLTPEAVRALIDHAFEELGCTLLRCAHFDGNHQSRRVMEKCGFTYSFTNPNVACELPGGQRDEHVTELARAQWEVQKLR